MRANPRILLIANRFPVPDKPYAGWYVRDHAQIHRELGFNLIEIYPHSPAASPANKYVPLLLDAIQSYRSQRPTLIHAHWILPSGFIGYLLARISGVPLVITSHGAFTRNYSEKSPLEKTAIRLVLNHADRIIAVGSDHKAQILKILEKDAEIDVIPMGIIFPGTLMESAEARASLGLDAGAFIIGYVGNLRKRKGVDNLIRAYSQIQKQDNSIQLKIVGMGEGVDWLEALCRELGLEWANIYLGPVDHDEVPGCYRSFDVVAIPSLDEPFGLVALEAMANGRAVVASKVGGLAENIIDGETGLLVPPGDPEALADAILKLRRDPGLRQRLADDGRQAASAHDIRVQAAKVAAIYEELLMRGKTDGE